MEDTEFQKKYEFNKPSKDDKFVVSCKSGYRAGKAGEYLLNLGYQRIRVYRGSFNDWVANGGELITNGIFSASTYSEI